MITSVFEMKKMLVPKPGQDPKSKKKQYIESNIGTFRCSPFELIMRTLQEEMKLKQIHLHSTLGINTIIINLSADKWNDGTLDENNNKAER